jgi:hypothetical protein
MLPAIESAMESDKKVKQSSISEKMEKALDNLEKYGIKVEPSLCLFMLTPIVQSGGKYNLDVANIKPYGQSCCCFVAALLPLCCCFAAALLLLLCCCAASAPLLYAACMCCTQLGRHFAVRYDGRECWR